MPDTFSFTSRTPRLGLPNLFSAQAQKEFTVNEAFALIDALLHTVVEGEANDPPATPIQGECWIVGSQPTGDWSSQEGQIACHQAGNWLFVSPIQDMTVFDRSLSRIARFNGGWSSAASVSSPAGGSVVDTEARAAIGEIIAALQAGGILASS